MKQVARWPRRSNGRPLNYSKPKTLASSQLHLERRKRFSGIELSKNESVVDPAPSLVMCFWVYHTSMPLKRIKLQTRKIYFIFRTASADSRGPDYCRMEKFTRQSVLSCDLNENYRVFFERFFLPRPSRMRNTWACDDRSNSKSAARCCIQYRLAPQFLATRCSKIKPDQQLLLIPHDELAYYTRKRVPKDIAVGQVLLVAGRCLDIRIPYTMLRTRHDRIRQTSKSNLNLF
ncbi:unnamed protein product [Trichogramma brassicae]|uniref:Uncharacterized protein n=1 Tax=Trichogramma brassicae TaxID=86971 RepID=A0A6H5IMR8_9HYME|nr:unnamed protein product [Trichogramma brassicae]